MTRGGRQLLLLSFFFLQPTLHVASLLRRQQPSQEFDDYRHFKQHLTDGLSSTDGQEPAQHHAVSLVQSCFEAAPLAQNNSALLIVSSNNSTHYHAARECHIHRPLRPGAEDYRPLQQLIVQPTTAAETAVLVQCVAAAKKQHARHMTISVRSGAHGFTGDGCRGDVILDMSRMYDNTDGVQVDRTTQQVTWSAGLLHGQVYAPLWQDHGLVLPGGAEMMVGTGGLWLGCGRGRLANVYGMTLSLIHI